MQPSKEIYMGL